MHAADPPILGQGHTPSPEPPSYPTCRRMCSQRETAPGGRRGGGRPLLCNPGHCFSVSRLPYGNWRFWPAAGQQADALLEKPTHYFTFRTAAACCREPEAEQPVGGQRDLHAFGPCRLRRSWPRRGCHAFRCVPWPLGPRSRRPGGRPARPAEDPCPGARGRSAVGYP